MKFMQKVAMATLFALAAGTAQADQPSIAMPDEGAAWNDYCGFASEQQLNAYMHHFTANALNSYSQYPQSYRDRVPVPTQDNLTYAPRFGYIYNFADEAAYQEWHRQVFETEDGAMISGDTRDAAIKTDKPFSLCQALDLAKTKGTSVLAIDEADRFGLMQVVPVPAP